MTRYEVLASLIRKHNWQTGAELGVFKGETYFHLLETFPDLVLIGVDRWEATPGPKQNRETGEASYERHPMEQYAEDVKRRAAIFAPRAVLYHMDTVEAAGFYHNPFLDFVFIDASHDTESVRRDIRAWRPLVKPSGMILGHDINWPSVERAVAAEFGENVGWMQANIWVARP